MIPIDYMRSHMMAEPSVPALTASVSLGDTCIADTGLLCSFSTFLSDWLSGRMSHTRTYVRLQFQSKI